MAGNKNSGIHTDLTPEVQSKIVEVLKVGNFRNVAARSADVAESTLSHWMARGKREKRGIYWDFRQAVLNAEADAEKYALEQVWKQFATDPANAKWYLERKHSKNWAGQRYEIMLLQKELKDLTAKMEKLLYAQHTGTLPQVSPPAEAGGPDHTVERTGSGE